MLNTFLKYIALIFFAFVFLGCTTMPAPGVPIPSNSIPFQGAETPPADQARLYIFRPSFYKSLISEQPNLFIDGVAKARLTYERYSVFVLTPGSHVISLEPRKNESPIWQSKTTVELSASKNYYLAIWNTQEITTTKLGPKVVPIGGVLPFILIPSDAVKSTAHDRGVSFETIRESEAIPELTGMHKAPLIENNSKTAP